MRSKKRARNHDKLMSTHCGLPWSLSTQNTCGGVGIGQWAYETNPGFFAQDNTTATGIPAIPPSFGLLDSAPDRWTNFFARIESLNHRSDRHTFYKVFLLGRHGEGFHNVAEAKYGTAAWDDYWSKLNGDGEITWGPDAELTSKGKDQALAATAAWRTELAAGIPLPGRFYTSPLTRSLDTCKITFERILAERHRHVKPVVVENCREEIGVHTCDKRRTKTYIKTTFSEFIVERGFSEDDLLWDPDIRETKAHVAERAKDVFDMIFKNDEEIFISITGHGGIINGFLATVGRPTYGLPTGGILPIVVKAVYTPS
ncbi:hypothetical protein Hypma_008411 [Hypsizygus marmoreus]|uniref:Phosphoglycerate mutase-like protein n=1 Tax=Hypsizygus marmoreus TaxID=39966 RepID=A0A369JYE1_HYPMA|nr:hypothetical protein Hypma_008411 [Hypsizygus marmoreus]